MMTAHGATARALRMLDDGSDGSLCSQAFAINDSGAAVGVSVFDGRSRAVLWEPDGGGVVDLAPDAPAAVAEAMSDTGTVAGTLGVAVKDPLQPPGVVDGDVLPFVWTRNGGLQVLALPPGSEMGQAIDVNDDGLVLVTGAVPSSRGLPRGLPVGTFVYDLAGGTYTPLPVTQDAADDVVALGHTIDARGRVSGGFVTLEGEFDWRHSPAVWASQSLEPTRLKADDAFVNACTGDAVAVGWRMAERGKPPTAVFWRDASAEPEPLPGQAALRANNAGLVVGIEFLSDSPGFPFSAALWDLRGGATCLEHPGAGSYGYGINGRGDVVGYVIDTSPGGAPAARAAAWPVA
jgi:hypothetical protein